MKQHNVPGGKSCPSESTEATSSGASKPHNKSYERVCKGCKTMPEAEAFEITVRKQLEKEVEKLKAEGKRIRQNKTVIAVVENYNGVQPILLPEAYELVSK